MVYELKTKENNADVLTFLDTIEDIQKKEESLQILDIMTRISGKPAKMWGKSIIGFGSYHYKYDSWQEGDFMRVGFSPRKANISIYIIPGYQFESMKEILNRLGKHKTSKGSCLYIKKLSDIDLKVLEEVISFGLDEMQKKYPE